MVPSVLSWIAFLTLVWWILEPVGGSWAAGMVAVAVGVGLRLYMGRFERVGLRPARLPRFGVYFLRQSVLGGWDVSRRALAPALPLAPDLMTRRLALPSKSARVFLCNALSLLPGTFAADLDGDELVVHVLVGGPGAESRLRELEARVTKLFEAGDA
ncbi:MAG: Na+/H+ antiporter subunit E [Gemmatimonadota bacterium]